MKFNLEQLNISLKIILIAFTLALVTFFDIITGNEIALSIFYLIPIFLSCWYISKNAGIIISLFSVGLWFFLDYLYLPPYTNKVVPYWNASVRIAFFLIVTYLLSALKSKREREKEIIKYIAHDLRSPLANILTGLKIMSEDLVESAASNQRELLEVMISTSNRMLIYVNSLLDLMRLEKGKLPLNISKFEVSDVLNKALDQVGLLAKEKEIEVNLDIHVQEIKADENLLLRIIVNLLSNSIKASSKKTHINVTVKNLDQQNIVFYLEDQGTGLKRGVVDIFDSKFIEDISKTDGGGIGLTFCKLAVQAHGGQIKLGSIEGKGTTVIFSLPK